MALHRFAPMGITIITRMLARRMATTDRTGFTAAYLLALGPGSTAFGVVVPFGAVVGADVIGTVEATGAAGVLTGADADADLMDEAALAGEAASRTDPLAVDSTAVAVFTAPVDFTAAVAAGSTVEVAVDSTEVAEAMAAATGN
jgi:hypothetical protein